ncbi:MULTISPECIES: glycosyltransferase family 52 [unclassified Pseudoalteromonas]|uniref:glycosyltransferase family 52 n=1 Tax=unclassified Pseudoalteromonas TaxID=194690 RepID=UPI0025B3158C|nr:MULTISPECIES: glycosyltransferase family 52 [unclassified Pseudoalteromonas]MDN3379117.1 glycosyltransferase family 52 [Pseudoalteromonas sp. APC 3893]MDN3387816.1 glycosyltransferase family 52 [Pseudoalteromonas sp. APC 4017]
MHKNIFVVNTQLHLLLAQSIISVERLRNCILISYGKDKMHSSLLLDHSLWSDLYELPAIDKKAAYSYIKKIKHLKKLNNSFLFWGNDYQLENQVVAHIIKPEKIYLFDDGLASYMDNIRKVTLQKKLAMKLFSNLLLGGALKNVTGIGHYRVDGRYCLSKELAKYANQAKEIHLSFSAKVINEVRSAVAEQPIRKPAALLLTQPITEYNALSKADEDAHLIRLAKEADRLEVETLVVKYHPGETKKRSLERLDLIKRNTQASVLVIERINNLPIEVIISDQQDNPFKFALSVYSTAILTLKLLRSDLNCISSLSKADVEKSEAFFQLFELFRKFKIKEVNSERVV